MYRQLSASSLDLWKHSQTHQSKQLHLHTSVCVSLWERGVHEAHVTVRARRWGGRALARWLTFSETRSGLYLHFFMLSLHLLQQDYCTLNFLPLGLNCLFPPGSCWSAASHWLTFWKSTQTVECLERRCQPPTHANIIKTRKIRAFTRNSLLTSRAWPKVRLMMSDITENIL